MAISEMAFVPATGWNDPTTFPEKVNNANDVRDMLQLLHDQTKDYLNDTVKPAIDSLQAGTIPTGKIENGAVTTPKLADGAVTNAKLGAKAVKQANIDDLAVGTGQIAAKAVTAAKIADATITATQIANTTITGAKMVNKTVTATQLADKAVTASQIADATITGAKMANKTVTATQIADTTITGGKLVNGTITSTQLSSTSGSEAVATGNIRAKAVTAAKIADATITATQIANTTITGAKMANGTVTATQLASNAVETAKIKDGSVTDAKIASGITGSKVSGALSNATLDGAKITSGTVAIARLPYETSLTANSDAKLPTSKAVATYVTGAAEQHVEIIPSNTSGTTQSIPANAVYSKTMSAPITVSNYSLIKVTLDVLDFNGSNGKLQLRVDGKNSGGSAVNYLLPAYARTTSAGIGAAVRLVYYLHSNGSGFCFMITTTTGSAAGTGLISAGSGFPAIITGLSVVRTDTESSAKTIYGVTADICGVK